MIEQTHYGVTEMAEVLGQTLGRSISKQAMSARMDTALFKEHCKVQSTRHGRMVPIGQFEAYVQAWIAQEAQHVQA